jgi:16S rRNA (cytosine967-C5)-methyltransferase
VAAAGPGGRLLYATCSVFKAEGQHQSMHFCNAMGPGAALLQKQSPGHLLASRDNSPQGVPGRGPALQDGFFYALIHKT